MRDLLHRTLATLSMAWDFGQLHGRRNEFSQIASRDGCGDDWLGRVCPILNFPNRCRIPIKFWRFKRANGLVTEIVSITKGSELLNGEATIGLLFTAEERGKEDLAFQALFSTYFLAISFKSDKSSLPFIS